MGGVGLSIFNGLELRKGVRSSPVPVRKPCMRPGRLAGDSSWHRIPASEVLDLGLIRVL